MLRVLRATVARSRRKCGSPSFARNTKTVALFDRTSPPSQTLRLKFLRNLSSFQSSRQGSHGPSRRGATEDYRTQESLTYDDFSDDCETSKSAEDDRILAGSEMEDDDGDEDLVAVSAKDPSSYPTDELDKDCSIDISNVPDELKEMLEDDYEIESAEEDLSFEGTAELLTIDEVKQVLEEVRARDVQIFSVQDRCEWADVMVVATGISDRHVRGIADALVYKDLENMLRQAGLKDVVP